MSMEYSIKLEDLLEDKKSHTYAIGSSEYKVSIGDVLAYTGVLSKDIDPRSIVPTLLQIDYFLQKVPDSLGVGIYVHVVEMVVSTEEDKDLFVFIPVNTPSGNLMTKIFLSEDDISILFDNNYLRNVTTSKLTNYVLQNLSLIDFFE